MSRHPGSIWMWWDGGNREVSIPNPYRIVHDSRVQQVLNEAYAARVPISCGCLGRPHHPAALKMIIRQTQYGYVLARHHARGHGSRCVLGLLTPSVRVDGSIFGDEPCGQTSSEFESAMSTVDDKGTRWLTFTGWFGQTIAGGWLNAFVRANQHRPDIQSGFQPTAFRDVDMELSLRMNVPEFEGDRTATELVTSRGEELLWGFVEDWSESHSGKAMIRVLVSFGKMVFVRRSFLIEEARLQRALRSVECWQTRLPPPYLIIGIATPEGLLRKLRMVPVHGDGRILHVTESPPESAHIDMAARHRLPIHKLLMRSEGSWLLDHFGIEADLSPLAGVRFDFLRFPRECDPREFTILEVFGRKPPPDGTEPPPGDEYMKRSLTTLAKMQKLRLPLKAVPRFPPHPEVRSVPPIEDWEGVNVATADFPPAVATHLLSLIRR